MYIYIHIFQLISLLCSCLKTFLPPALIQIPDPHIMSGVFPWAARTDIALQDSESALASIATHLCLSLLIPPWAAFGI